MPLINPGSDTKKKLRLKIHNSKHPLPLLRHQLFASAFEIVLFCEIFVFFNSVKIDLSTWNIAQIWQNLISINETPHEPHQIANSIVENIKRNASVHAKLHFHTTSPFCRTSHKNKSKKKKPNLHSTTPNCEFYQREHKATTCFHAKLHS